MKICPKCKVPQDEANFHKSSSWCKLCKSLKYRAEYKSAPLSERPARNIERERELNNARCKRYRKVRPERERARGLVNAALKFGRLVRPNRCMMCTQDKRLEAHHDDYSKPLVVRWLCKQCHESWHINNTPKY